MRYREFRYYSPEHDAECVRLSMTDEPRDGKQPREYFMIVKRKPDRGWRDRRDEALATIAEAIGMGLEPGEVRVE